MHDKYFNIDSYNICIAEIIGHPTFIHSAIDILSGKNDSPDIVVFRNGILLKEVTLLLSLDKSTDGNGAGVPSECDRSWTARPEMNPIELLLIGPEMVAPNEKT